MPAWPAWTNPGAYMVLRPLSPTWRASGQTFSLGTSGAKRDALERGVRMGRLLQGQKAGLLLS